MQAGHLYLSMFLDRSTDLIDALNIDKNIDTDVTIETPHVINVSKFKVEIDTFMQTSFTRRMMPKFPVSRGKQQYSINFSVFPF